MNYNEFMAAVLNEIQEHFQDRATVTINSVMKNNGVERNGLVIMEKGRSVSPTIYLNDFFKLYKDEVGIGEITEQILNLYEEQTRREMDFSFVSDFEKVKKHIVFRLINKELNRDLIMDIPHEDFLDLAVCYAVLVQNDHFGNGMILIHHQHMKMWGVDEKMIKKEAVKNTPKLLKPVWCSIESMLDQLLFEGKKEEDFEESILYVLTNSEKYFGAGCMLYQGLLSEIAETLDSDFFIIPSSVNEVILVKKEYGMQKEEIRKLVKDVNDEVVCKEEILSYMVYEFDRKSGIIHL